MKPWELTLDQSADLTPDPNYNIIVKDRVEALLKERMAKAFRSGWLAGDQFIGCRCYPGDGDFGFALYMYQEMGSWQD